MSKIFCVMTLVYLIAAIQARDKLRTDLEQDDLRGPLQTVRVEKAYFLGESPTKEVRRVVSHITVYNQSGYKVEEIDFDNSGAQTGKKVFNYDGAGSLTRIDHYNADNIFVGKTVRTNHPPKNEIQEVYYDKEGIPGGTNIRVYNEQGRAVKKYTVDNTGNLVYEMALNYDSNGNMISTTSRASDKGIVAINTFTYMNDGRHVEMIGSDASGVPVSKVVISKNTQETKFKFEMYDAKGTLVNVKLVERSKLDSYGNWTIETVSQSDIENNAPKLVEVTYRTISYY